MKKLAIMCIFAASILGILISISALKNEHKPDETGIKRVIALREELRIKEKGEGFYFRSPKKLKVDKEGNIYILDDKQLLKFRSDGTFEVNMFKFGHGPGELTFISDYCIEENEIVLFNIYPAKIVRFGLNGEFRQESRCRIKGETGFLSCLEGNCLFTVRDFPVIKKDESVIKLDNRLIMTTPDGRMLFDNLYEYSSEIFAVRLGLDFSTADISNFLFCRKDGHSFFFSYTPEYDIKLFDTKIGKPKSLRLKDKYGRIRVSKENEKYLVKSKIISGDKVYTPPLPGYYDDIIGLIMNGDKLWALTSTYVREKGLRVDVYDIYGKYSDSLFLRLPAHINPYYLVVSPPAIAGDYFYLVERDKEYVFTIAKYKIMN